MTRISRLQILILLACLAASGCQREQRFPNRPIFLICPWAKGGGTDRVSRQIAIGLERELGVPVNVVNATGGAGVTGHARGALARPDGYTLTTITPELTMLHWQGKTTVTFHDFEPLMSVNGDCAALLVRFESPFATIEDLADAIKREPGKVKASGSAFASIWHVALVGWLDTMGHGSNDVTWVPEGGANPSLQALMAGSVDVVCCSVPEARALLDGKKIRCLAVMADERMSDLPNVPTLRDSGCTWSLCGWRGIALPKGVPEERRQLILNALRIVINGAEYKQFLANAGFGHRAGEPDQFRKTLQKSDDELGKRSGDLARSQKERIGPEVFPIILGSLFVLTLGGICLTGHLNRSRDTLEITRSGWLRMALFLGALLFYVLTAEWLGFLVTAAVIVVLLLWRLKTRWPVMLAVTICLVPAVYQLFAVALRVQLPWGLFGW